MPGFFGFGDEFGRVLLDEVAGVGNGDEGEIGVEPVPGVVQGRGEEGGAHLLISLLDPGGVELGVFDGLFLFTVFGFEEAIGEVQRSAGGLD